METIKKVAIITDGAAPLQEAAESIAAIIGGYPGHSAAVIQAERFSGTDLLPAYAIFLGCQESKPSSFAYIEALLGHINLAGRSCGIFSSNAKALGYLSALVRDSEIATGSPFQIENGKIDTEKLKSWVQKVLKEAK